MSPGAIIDRLRGEGLDLELQGGRLTVVGPQTAITPGLVEAVRERKAELTELLRRLPKFSFEEQDALSRYYCSRPRAERLVMHKRGVELHNRGWPRQEADCQAIKEFQLGDNR